MLKKTWRRSSSPAMWAVALGLVVPTLVEAQTQLLPLAPIQRERVPCPMEDPVYGLYRHQYFGYFPTCWRSFPQGWGCPSPEAPNLALEFQRQPRDKPPESFPDEMERGPAPIPGEPDAPPGRNPLPPLPGGDPPPFDIDTAPGPRDNRPRMPEIPSVPALPGGRAPGDTGAPPPRTSRNESSQAVPAAPGVTDQPNDLAAPLLALPDPVEAPTGATATEPGLDPRRNPAAPIDLPGAPTGAIAPMPASSRPGMNPSPSPMRNPNSSAGATASALAPIAVAPVAMPVQAPQRRGPLSTLFGGMTSRLRR